MSELHFVFLKYNADGGAAMQEKEGRWEGGMLRHTVPGSSLSLCSASQSRDLGPNRLIGKGWTWFYAQGGDPGRTFYIFMILAYCNLAVCSCEILGRISVL